MWIKRTEYVFLKSEWNRLNEELLRLREGHQELLSHLGLAEWEITATARKIEIVTNEEYVKRARESLSALGGLGQMAGATMQAQMSMGGLGRGW